MTDAAVIGRVASVIAHEPEAAISKLSRQAHPRTYLNRYLIARAPAVLAVGAVAQRSIAGILAKLGHPGATLDDSYIHFQYARALAEGHALRYAPGAPVSSGSTSFLWPALLAPFWALGLRGELIVWVAWGFSYCAWAALAWEASRLTERLAGRTAAIGAGAMTIAFGGFAWCAASGMEVVPFAWAIARASRRACDWAEGARASRSTCVAAELVGLGWLSALFRPEGAVTALFVAATLGAFGRCARQRLFAMAALGAVIAPPLLLWIVTGSPRSTTAMVKLLPGNPYYSGNALVDAVIANARLLVSTILDGDKWSAEFLPKGGAPLAMAGLGAVAWLGVRRSSRWRAAAVILMAMTMFAPCLYSTFLWNRLRYLWPFATGWIVGLACLSRVLGDVAATLFARGRAVAGILCGTFVGLLAAKLDGVQDDVARSASDIDRQQVTLGRWAFEHLPREARIGVNDTGAIAYFGGRATFDIVGLTTPGEARYWVAGPASRFEHYERLRAAAPSAMPTHFIVYADWMALGFLLGEPLAEATVPGSTILGGQTMRAYAADYSKLGSGESPWSRSGPVVDVLDVADLESESEHDYALLGARDGEQMVFDSVSPGGQPVVDGGRTNRSREQFVARLPPGQAILAIVRLAGPPRAVVRATVNDVTVTQFELADDADGWSEQSFEIPARSAKAQTRIDLRVDGGTITVFHYWFAAFR